MERSNIAIIGGGVAGLVAANQVVADGGQATLIEATAELGGRAQTKRVDGFSLNQGPHALYLGGAFHAALQDFKVPVSGRGPDLLKGLALWGETIHPFPTRRAEGRPEPLDEAEATALSTFLHQVATGPSLSPGQSLDRALASLPAKSRTVIEALVRLSTYVDAPTQVDAKAALDQLRLSFQGTIYVDGGWGGLTEGLQRAALAGGAVLRCGEKVTAIDVTGDSARVQLRGGRSEAYDAVILALPPRNAAAMVPSSAELAALSEATRSIRLVALDLALSRLERQDANFVLGMDRPTYLSVHSVGAQLAPPGGALVHLARYLPPGDAPSSECFEELCLIADDLHPGWRGHVVHEQRLTGATVAFDFPEAARGGRRATIRLSDTPGVFICGDWVGDEGLLADAAAASGRAAAVAALSHAGEGSAA